MVFSSRQTNLPLNRDAWGSNLGQVTVRAKDLRNCIRKSQKSDCKKMKYGSNSVSYNVKVLGVKTGIFTRMLS